MKNYTVRPYESGDYGIWNAFLAKAKNATFLFHRDFMDYHSDRFDDFSLLVWDEDKLVALLAANRKENQVFSHQGLTYGGLVYGYTLKLDAVITVFKSVLEFLSSRKIATLQLKMLPTIYHQNPAQELDYALFLADARLVRRDTLAVLDLSKEANRSQIRKRGIRKGMAMNLEVREEAVFEDFWNKILIPNLNAKHSAKPVHTIDEITSLKGKFPKNIRQFNVYHNNEIVAGTTIFESESVAHVQYISGNDSKSELGSLDFLIVYLTEKVFAEKAFFDFGISNEEHGKKLNLGLSYWKESFGAHIICQDFYQVETQNHVQLENVFR